MKCHAVKTLAGYVTVFALYAVIGFTLHQLVDGVQAATRERYVGAPGHQGYVQVYDKTTTSINLEHGADGLTKLAYDRPATATLTNNQILSATNSRIRATAVTAVTNISFAAVTSNHVGNTVGVVNLGTNDITFADASPVHSAATAIGQYDWAFFEIDDTNVIIQTGAQDN